MKDSPNLDVLRTVAVLLVVGSHLAVNLGWSTNAFSLDALGRLGVAFFFVHTTVVLLQSLERTGPAPLPFFIRRAFRIYPLAAAVVLLLAAMRWLAGVPVDAAAVASNVLLVQNVSGHDSAPPPLWSLPFEVQMYLALPAVFLLARAGGARAIAALLASAVAVVGALMAAGLPYLLLQYLPCFLPGALAFALGSRGKAPEWVLFALLAACAVVVPLHVAAGLPEVPVQWVVCLALGLTIPHVREMNANGAAARAAKVLVTYSYGVYLTHWFAIGIGFAMAPGLPVAGKLALFLCVLWLFSVAAYRWIERPGIELGKRIATALTARGSRLRAPARSGQPLPAPPPLRSSSGS